MTVAEAIDQLNDLDLDSILVDFEGDEIEFITELDEETVQINA